MKKEVFIVLETKIVNNVVLVWGGVVIKEEFGYDQCMASFKWYKLEEVK